MLDCVLEADEKGRVVSKPSSESGKFRRSLAPSIDLLRLKLPRFSKAIEKGHLVFLIFLIELIHSV